MSPAELRAGGFPHRLSASLPSLAQSFASRTREQASFVEVELGRVLIFLQTASSRPSEQVTGVPRGGGHGPPDAHGGGPHRGGPCDAPFHFCRRVLELLKAAESRPADPL